MGGSPPRVTSEGAIVELLRAARSPSRLAGTRPKPVNRLPPFWDVDKASSIQWPPLRPGEPRETEWKAVLDSYSQETYYWNETTGVSTWEAPAGGRRSAERSGALAKAAATRLAQSLRESASKRKYSAFTRRGRDASGANASVSDATTRSVNVRTRGDGRSHGRCSTYSQRDRGRDSFLEVDLSPPWYIQRSQGGNDSASCP